jgi:hypothetical protein
MMGTEMTPETSVTFNELTVPIALDDDIFNRLSFRAIEKYSRICYVSRGK